MSPILRACVVCGTPVAGSNRCAKHADTRRSMTTTQRGYGWQHRQRRAALLAQAIGTACPICGQTMQATDKLDLDHTEPLIVNPTSLGNRITHASCNRGGRGSPRERRRPA